VTVQIGDGQGAMVSEGKGRLFRRKDGKYLVYLPKDLAEDSMFPFPFRSADTIFVKVSFALGDNKLLVEKWSDTQNQVQPKTTPVISN
jgi:hypothetical protein